MGVIATVPCPLPCCKFLCPSSLWPPTQACDVDIFHDKVSQTYTITLAVSQKIALGRLPSLCPLFLRCLDVVIQLKRGDGLIRLLLGESQLLHEVVSLVSPHINVLSHQGFQLIVHQSSSWYLIRNSCWSMNAYSLETRPSCSSRKSVPV